MLNKDEKRNLSLAVAERVMGFKWYWRTISNGNGRAVFFSPQDASKEFLDHFMYIEGKPDGMVFYDDSGCPDYADDIACAFKVIEKMREFILQDPIKWDSFVNELGYESMRELIAEINPISICRAALAAVESNNVE